MKYFILSKVLIICLISGGLISCSEQKDNEEKEEITAPKIQVAGSLMDVMHQGDISAKIRVDTLAKEYLYGLGALAGLKGEATIINGKVYETTVDTVGARITLNDSLKAALLVYAYVKQWDTLLVAAGSDIENMIKNISEERSLQVPFPFMLVMTPEQLNYHVINFQGEKATLKNHKYGSLAGGVSQEEVRIIGFYATNAQGIYTHKDSNTHMHFLSADSLKSGHVDFIDLGEKSIEIYIPAL